MTYESVIKRHKLTPYRKLYMLRRTDTAYESTWVDVTKYVVSFGSVSWTTDNVRPNKFEQSGMTIIVRNDNKQFQDETLAESVWSGALTPYKTLFRVDCGYYDTDGSVVPADQSVFFGILVDDIQYNQTEATLIINPISWAMQEVPASKIQVPATVTASNLIAAIRDVRDITATGNYLLRPYLTATSWDIATTTAVYTDFVATGLDNYDCWSLMELLAETEGNVIYFGSDGMFHFKPRAANSAVSWIFNGIGITDSTYGVNVVDIDNVANGYDKVFQRVRIQHKEASTSTSFYTLEPTFSVGDRVSPWKYGVRTYEFENLWLNTATVASLATTIQSNFYEPKKEVSIKTKMITTLDILDRVKINYIGSPSRTPAAYWGRSYWGRAYWTGAKGGITLRDFSGFITSLEHNLDEFYSTFIVREV